MVGRGTPVARVTYRAGVGKPWVIETTEWALTYPVQPSTPIGVVRREGVEFRAWCSADDLGRLPSGDAAAEAIWARFLEQSRTQHEQASVTHGGAERHA
jgi:hypothetical protein